MTTSDTLPKCPACGQNDQVAKVSRQYILARENKQRPEPFAPPSGGRALTRSIHPDMVVGALTLFAIFFFVKIYQQQPNMLVPSLAVLAAFYLGYFLLRKKILGRYQADRNKESAEQVSIEAATGEWMKLYYCARDKGVFDPSDPEPILVPLDQMRLYALKKAQEKSTKR